MTSKEALKELRNDISNRALMFSDEKLDIIEKDLDLLENIKTKTLLPYSDRKKIAKEYEQWCKDNNIMISDPANMVTWLLCIKLKEWLKKK